MDQSPGFREAFHLLWKWQVLIVAVALGASLGAFRYSSTRPERFEASSRLVVRPVLPQAALTTPTASQGFGPLGLDLPVEAQAEVLGSFAVSKRVKEELDLPQPVETIADSVRASQVGQQTLEVYAALPDPQLVMDLVNAFADEYLAFRREQAVGVIESITANLQEAATTLRAEIDRLNGRIEQLAAVVASIPAPAPPVTGPLADVQGATPEQAARRAKKEAEVERLTAERNELLDRLTLIEARVDDLEVGRSLSAGAGEVVERATLPTSPIGPRPIRDAAIAFVTAGIVAAALLFLRHYLDQRIRSRDEAAQAVGASVLAAFPREARLGVGRQARRASSNRIAMFQSLRANLSTLGVGGTVRRILVAQTRRGDAQARVGENLANAYCEAGIRTLLISGDPRLQGTETTDEGSPTLLNVLEGKTAAIVPTPSGLLVLPAPEADHDRMVPLFERFEALLTEAEKMVDLIMVEASAVSDGFFVASIARSFGSALLVVTGFETKRSFAARSATMIRRAGASVIGVVLFRADASDESLGIVDQSPQVLVGEPEEGLAEAPTRGVSNGNGDRTKWRPGFTLPEAPPARDT